MWIAFRDRFLDAVLGVDGHRVLNPPAADAPSPSPPDLGAHLIRTMLHFKSLAMDATGRRVDYARIRDSHAYRAFRSEWLTALRRFDPGSLQGSLSHRLAFWINLYNALVIDAVICFGRAPAAGGPRALAAFFRQAAYCVGGQRLSCDDIEHGILRANRGHPWYPGPQFAAADPRRQWVIPHLDPRIHFALNCAGQSCPPIGVYHPDRLEAQLNAAARHFIAQEVQIAPDGKRVFLSRIFRWYLADFGGKAGLAALLQHYGVQDIRRLRWEFTPYRWQLNGDPIR